MVYKSVQYGKILVDLFFTITFIFFTKNQKQNNWHCVTCYVISMDYTLINHSSRPIRTRGLIRSCSYCKKYYLLKELSLSEGFPAVVEYVSLS